MQSMGSIETIRWTPLPWREMLAPVTWLLIAMIGVAVGFLGGLFGKGGAAVATPLLAAIGVPPMIAVASPLPAAVPSSVVAYRAYREHGYNDRQVVRWSLFAGAPATVIGALLTWWVEPAALIAATDVLIVGIGLRLALRRPGRSSNVPPSAITPARIVAVAGVVGLLSGLLANAGGFLLAPLYLGVLRLPIKPAFASSLAVAAVLAIPGTVVHTALGHIDWRVVAVFASASVPLSFLGARVAVAADASKLERGYGTALVVLGTVLLLAR